MRILFIADPLASFKIYKDTTYAMMVEADRRGHALAFCEQGNLYLRDGRVFSSVQALTLKKGADWYSVSNAAPELLSGFDAVVMRKDPPFDMEYFYSTHLLARAEEQGARVYNSGRSLRDHNEKLAITEFPQFTAPTLVTRRESLLRDFISEHGDAILKPLDGMGGAGIFRVRHDDPNVGSIIEMLTALETRTIMAQRYIPEIVKGDKRVLLIQGKPVPFALARIPKAGETRGNLAAGGRGVAQPISARDREIAESLGPILVKRGLLLVGLDIIGDCLTEINVTSPTCFQEITQQSGFDVSALFIDALEQQCSVNATKSG